MIALAGLFAGSPAEAQDVELLGQIYGTRPPTAYFERVQADPGAYQFRRGWRADEMPDIDPGRGEPYDLVGPQPVLGQRGGVVEGTYRFPTLLGLFQDSPAPAFTRDEVHGNFFVGPNPTGTIPEFYAEVSGGKVNLIGETTEWVRSDLTQLAVSGNVSGLSNPGQVWRFIMDIVSKLDATSAVDWTVYDNDGPDGIANSGDDDGYVDVLAVIHPTRGAECSPGPGQGELIWSHRWSVRDASGQDIVTTSIGANLNPIRIDDYTIQPLIDCAGGGDINRIGVFAHELGHGFGLPDLYDTLDNSHGAAGEWDLMATGAWGCQGYTTVPTEGPARPCHMGAWSKAALGWVDVVTVPPGTDDFFVLEPVLDSHMVYRVDALDGSGDYFLLENRQAQGFDGAIHGPGMLVWQIDPARVQAGWPVNRVNSDRTRMGVRVREADGFEDLARQFGNRGDAGDPFPGSEAATAFHAGTLPAARSSDGTAVGVTIREVAENGPDIEFELISGYRTLTLRTETTGLPAGPWQIGSTLAATSELQSEVAPFESVVVAAPGGFLEGAGVRAKFDGWVGLVEPQTFVLQMTTEDRTIEARFGPLREFLLDIGADAVPGGFLAGRVTLVPGFSDSWYDQGTFVQAEATPEPGFSFSGWLGDLAGAPNPTTFNVSGPLAALATFALDFDTERILAPFLLTAVQPTSTERDYLDAVGNQNGRYDLGDLRAFVVSEGIGR